MLMKEVGKKKEQTHHRLWVMEQELRIGHEPKA
jgi:hypothetical protein